MALFYECMLKCARKLLDTADIVREVILRQLSEFGADVGSQAAGNSFSGCRLGRKPHGGTAAHDSFGGSAAVSRGKTTYGVISNTEPAAVRPEVVP
jgi:hypothetical protein